MVDKMISKLEINFMDIQARIEEINSKEKIDIKEISDLQRFIDMQSKIAISIITLKCSKKEC